MTRVERPVKQLRKAMNAKKKASKLKITQVRSLIRRPADQKRNMAALGLRRMHQSVVHDDSPGIRGILTKVGHLVQVEEAS